MSRIVIEDLPSLDSLSEEELAEIFGAGRKDSNRRLSFQSLEDRKMYAADFASQLAHAAGTFHFGAADVTQGPQQSIAVAAAQNAVNATTAATTPELSTDALDQIFANKSDVAAIGAKPLPTRGAPSSTVGSSSVSATQALVLNATAVSATQINLSWGAVSNSIGYVVYASANSGSWLPIAKTGAGTTSCLLPGALPGVTYEFQVAAVNVVGSVTWSNVASVTPKVAPAAPNLTVTAASSTQIKLSWTSVSGAVEYVIEYSVNGGAWQTLPTVSSGYTSYTASGATPGATYSFKIAAVTSANIATWSSVQTVKTPIPTPTPAPNITEPAPTITLEGSGQTITTSYAPVSGALFGSSGLPSYTDIQQGALLGDCWLVSGLAAVAARAPLDIVNMFTAEGTAVENGATVSLYKVRFYDNGVAEYVTVDTELPVAYQGYTFGASVNNGVLWVALAEKAYIEANALGYVQSSNVGVDSYNAIQSGDGNWSISAITGQQAGAVNLSNIASDWNAGDFIVIGSDSNASGTIVGGHAYAMIGYNPSNPNAPYELFNPWNVTSGVNNLYQWSGRSVYGGAFYASPSQLSQDFDEAWATNNRDSGGIDPMQARSLAILKMTT